ncbi:MAG TPA: glycosyltransferase family 4 protein [Roseiflexaceae bacterium]|nr:glycosyltransferase family 4 protein [Roseiflexaceae bacterium]
MRILHVVEATIAGVRTHVQVVTAGLDQRRFQSTVACPLHRDHAYGDDQFVTYLANAGIPIVPVAMRRAISPRSDFAALWRLVSLFRRERFDIIHLHSSKAGFLGRVAARIAGVSAAVVYSPHGLSFLGDQPLARRWLYRALERLAGRLGDRIIAVSPSEREQILRAKLARAEQVMCIENGVPPIRLPAEYDRAAQRRALGQAGDAPLIGTVARLSRQKNPELFLQAAARVLRNLPGARFVWCGGGELANAVERRAQELGIAHACHVLGHRDDSHQILAALDVFWLTSDYEGWPLAPMEAMALGVPVVATDVIGTRDLLGGGAGLLVPRGNAATLATTTVELLQSPEGLASLAREGHAFYREYGTAQRMIRELERFYEDLVAGRSRMAPAAAPEALP